MKALYAHLAEQWTIEHPDDPKTADDIRAILTAPSIDLMTVMSMLGYLDSFATSSHAEIALQGFHQQPVRHCNLY